MFRRILQSIFVIALLASLSLTMAQTAPAQDPAQAAAAQAVTAQAAAVQAAAQARTAQAAARKAALTAAATPAGPAQVAAQAASTQAAAQAAAAQVAANQAAAQAVLARQSAVALANSERQANAAQALAARQQAAAAKAAGAPPASTAIAKSVTSIPGTVAPAKPAGTAPSTATNPSWQSAVSNILGSGSATPAGAGAKPGATAGKSTGKETTPAAAPTPAWETLVSNILSNGNANSAGGKSGAPAKGGTSPEGSALAPDSTTGGPAHTETVAPKAGAAHVSPNPAIPNVGLGMAESGNTMLTVMGCMRQGLQVACETQLNNENKTETLVETSAAWTDTLLIDDRGDRHERSMGFFLNIDGEQRTAMDVPYGQSARYILVFNDVPAKVTTVSLHSPSGGLNVVNIPLADPSADAAQTTTTSADAAAGAGTASGAAQAAPASKAKQAKNAKASAPAATPN